MPSFGLRSLRNRLAAVFGLIVLGAIATIYLSTLPRLEDRLTAQKLDALEADAQRYAGGPGGLADAIGTDKVGEPLAKSVTARRVALQRRGAGHDAAQGARPASRCRRTRRSTAASSSRR